MYLVLPAVSSGECQLSLSRCRNTLLSVNLTSYNKKEVEISFSEKMLTFVEKQIQTKQVNM